MMSKNIGIIEHTLEGNISACTVYSVSNGHHIYI